MKRKFNFSLLKHLYAIVDTGTICLPFFLWKYFLRSSSCRKGKAIGRYVCDGSQRPAIV